MQQGRPLCVLHKSAAQGLLDAIRTSKVSLRPLTSPPHRGVLIRTVPLVVSPTPTTCLVTLVISTVVLRLVEGERREVRLEEPGILRTRRSLRLQGCPQVHLVMVRKRLLTPMVPRVVVCLASSPLVTSSVVDLCLSVVLVVSLPVSVKVSWKSSVTWHGSIFGGIGGGLMSGLGLGAGLFQGVTGGGGVIGGLNLSNVSGGGDLR